METANRTLTADVIAALTYWPGIIDRGQKNPPDPVDLTVLLPFLTEMLQNPPWWNRDWLLGFHAKIGDVVLGPANAPAGQPEPHPFGKVFTRLMDLREVSVEEMGRRTKRAMSTINRLRSGRLNPHPVLLKEIAMALDMSEADIRAIAGVDDGID
ncbi:helix-turn-helix domain-containing protein [Actinomadura madurae]|uniref:helix-turn-helix domain-containing protein n=1 Tax=Actinomadura madurae TaxID=1993 RepID=UPI002027075C|nr:helix-turn-helix transcriptional regulator [Actinomadura madurae]MCP9949146.1 helix-turn-helix domain-containing protein [Actinomadura madurae]MCP9965915.1 helix-turn-helix domain-containing protein [Actinomadura madurae]MCP9978389.1 helix-turn-helix domain-containing protein [Actinomadura madurae]MCQ0010089.1 helix-turn-helix domain-containing protein [Actinomadura madurae]MCQ0014596.1 helix-turn-helix domain-containing protein [Actinomadura madurae]